MQTPGSPRATTDAVKQAADHGDQATRDAVRAELENLEASLTWRALGIAGLATAALRLLGWTADTRPGRSRSNQEAAVIPVEQPLILAVAGGPAEYR